jgi:hypothetical protein
MYTILKIIFQKLNKNAMLVQGVYVMRVARRMDKSETKEKPKTPK